MSFSDPRIALADEDKTLRSKILDAIEAALAEATFSKDGTDPDVLLFEYTGRGVLDDIEQQTTPGMCLEEGDETKDDKAYMVVDKRLRLYVHFKVIRAEGVDPTPMINYYFGRIVQVLVTSDHFAGLAMDIDEAGNSVQYQGQSDPEPGGTVMLDVEYRHGRGNQFSEEVV